MKNTQRGFTLLELLLVIAVIGILASLAVAGYRSHLQTANRQAAVATLQLAQQAMERGFLRNNTYVRAVLDDTFNQMMPASYTFKTVSATATTYELSSVSTNDALCGTMTIDQTGKKEPAAHIQECWGR